jgi:large-conductance mechanosensitive channel
MVRLISKLHRAPPPAIAAPSATETLLTEIRDLLKSNDTTPKLKTDD